MKHREGKKVLSLLSSFSKIITIVWLAVWIESIIFSQLATLFSFGDAISIQYVLQTVTDIGVIIAGFYFSSKTVENVAKGIERHRLDLLNRENINREVELEVEEFERNLNSDDSDLDNIPLY